MIIAVDVAYQKETALAGGILFHDWADKKPLQEMVVTCPIPDNYIPGHFYRRELPCIEALLEQIQTAPDCILIDGFVHLGRSREPGLGKHLRNIVGENIGVIGVAKTPFRDTPRSCEVLRGKSRKPLYVTADGIAAERAKFLITRMHGKYRIPTLLKCVDRLCRKEASLT